MYVLYNTNILLHYYTYLKDYPNGVLVLYLYYILIHSFN